MFPHCAASFVAEVSCVVIRHGYVKQLQKIWMEKLIVFHIFPLLSGWVFIVRVTGSVQSHLIPKGKKLTEILSARQAICASLLLTLVLVFII